MEHEPEAWAAVVLEMRSVSGDSSEAISWEGAAGGLFPYVVFDSVPSFSCYRAGEENMLKGFSAARAELAASISWESMSVIEAGGQVSEVEPLDAASDFARQDSELVSCEVRRVAGGGERVLSPGCHMVSEFFVFVQS